MIFKKIEIENFGIFRGKHVFDLSPVKAKGPLKPIILFGGKNGSGKTTLFEAIRLCLYGSSFKGKKLHKSRYHMYLRQRLNRYTSGVPNSQRASVSVEFEYAGFGHIDTYSVRRSWKCDDQQTTTLVEIHQNGKPLRDIDEKQWQDFLEELVPIGVSRLFFFDGERIQNLAEDHTNNKHLIGSIHSLLGIDLVERLQTDLRIYLSRKAKEENSQMAREISKFENKEKMLKQQLDSTLQNRAQIQSQIDRVHAEIEDQEHQIAIEGGGFASKREKLKLQRRRLDDEIEATKEKIRKLCANLLPFALVPDLCHSLRERLFVEERYQQQVTVQAALKSMTEPFLKEVGSESFWKEFPLLYQHRAELANRIVESFKRNVNVEDGSSIRVFHPVSSVDRNKLLDWIDQALNQVPIELRTLSANLERLVRQRQEVDTQLHRAPLDDVLHPMVQKINELHEELGVLQEKYRHLDEDVNRVQNELNRVVWEIDKLLAQEEKSRKLSERMELARSVQAVLNEFVTQLRREKMNDLCDRFLECFKWLSNKEHLIEKMEINPNDFSLKLWGPDGIDDIPKSQLSAGEKQIYAVAMLWALAGASGRPLPFIIDTPLGRLDASHRENIVQNFFPHASHQVILFSTDTEIDQRLFKKLQPHVSKAYHLEYNETAKTTCASSGYFWRPKKKEVVVSELQ